MAAAAAMHNAHEGSDAHEQKETSLYLCVLSITCNGEHRVKAAVSVRQMQPVAHLDLVSSAPSEVHQGATNIAAQLEHVLVDVKVLAIATACQGQDGQLQHEHLVRNDLWSNLLDNKGNQLH